VCVYLNPPAANAAAPVMLSWISKVGEPCSADVSVSGGRLSRVPPAQAAAPAAAAPAPPTPRQQAVEQALHSHRDWRARAGRPAFQLRSLPSRAAVEGGARVLTDGDTDGVPFSAWMNASSSGSNGPLAAGCPQTPIPSDVWGAAPIQVSTCNSVVGVIAALEPHVHLDPQRSMPWCRPATPNAAGARWHA
jgi:hypothetical protein